jgi:hypothetical protein
MGIAMRNFELRTAELEALAADDVDTYELDQDAHRARFTLEINFIKFEIVLAITLLTKTITITNTSNKYTDVKSVPTLTKYVTTRPRHLEGAQATREIEFASHMLPSYTSNGEDDPYGQNFNAKFISLPTSLKDWLNAMMLFGAGEHPIAAKKEKLQPIRYSALITTVIDQAALDTDGIKITTNEAQAGKLAFSWKAWEISIAVTLFKKSLTITNTKSGATYIEKKLNTQSRLLMVTMGEKHGNSSPGQYRSYADNIDSAYIETNVFNFDMREHINEEKFQAVLAQLPQALQALLDDIMQVSFDDKIPQIESRPLQSY